jgi:hypothetical protein
MVAVAHELPNTGYALEVDGRLKTEFETKEGAWTGAEELKKASRCCGSKSMTPRQGRQRNSNFHQAEVQPTSRAASLCGLIWQSTSD